MQEYFDIAENDNSTLDHLMEGFQLIGFDWRYKYVNSTIITQSKLSRKSDLLGYTMMEKFPGIENTEMFKVLEECMGQRISRDIENQFYFPDDSAGWFELRIEPVPQGIFILSMDITEHKKAEHSKKEYLKGLEEMLFMTSHKLRVPIVQILGMSNLLENAKISPEELNKMIGYMKESALSLDKFTRQLTVFIDGMKKKAKDKAPA
jgi:signal transduction histidine kinase